MSSPVVFSAESTVPLPEGLVVAGAYASEADAFQRSLVVLAMGESCWLVATGQGHSLLVDARVKDGVREQLARFERESVGWPPPPIADDPPVATPGWAGLLLWATVVLWIFALQQRHPSWADAGALDPRAMFRGGEVWRALTALFLHADAAHVISNVLSGLLVFSAVQSTFGRARGWAWIAVSALAGNLAVAALNLHAAYESLGASTAIFAGLGLLTGRAARVAHRSDHPHRGRAMFGAAGTGVVVLALYGAGGVRVDVAAHVTGFLAGVVLGFVDRQPRRAVGSG